MNWGEAFRLGVYGFMVFAGFAVCVVAVLLALWMVIGFLGSMAAIFHGGRNSGDDDDDDMSGDE